MKILISVLSLNKEPYIGLEKTIRETWASENHEDVEVIYYYGDSNEIKLIGDRLFLDSPEGLMNIGHKTLKMYEYILENFTFDYIFRTNSSSYVNIEKLKEFISDKPKEKFYSGVIGTFNGGLKYASGSGYFISKDLVNVVILNKGDWDHRIIDDVSLGKLMGGMNITIYEGRRYDIPYNYTYDPEMINHYHYRLKTISMDRNGDVMKMKELHKELKNNTHK